MNRLILVKYKDTRKNKTIKDIYNNDYEFRKTFDNFQDLNFDDIEILPLQVSGKNYTEKQSSLRETAIAFQHFVIESADIEFIGYYDIVRCCQWFEAKAKIYGLTNEFRENAII